MQPTRTELSDIKVYPHYRDIPIEVEPVIENGAGRYVTGQFLSQSYHALTLGTAEVTSDLHVGATYNCVAKDEHGMAIKTHWFYCTSLSPFPSFGLIRNWSDPVGVAPLLPNIDSPFVKLEELSDIVTIFPALPPAERHAQAQIGRRGWLVMTRIASPYAMGILVEDPVLPPSMSVGSHNLTMTANCLRTHQSIGFEQLTCVSADNYALFLQRERL